MNTDLRKALKHELRYAGERYSDTYESWTDESLLTFINSMKNRREREEQLQEAFLSKQRGHEPEDDLMLSGEACGTLQAGCGGGHRVIRSSKGLS